MESVGVRLVGAAFAALAALAAAAAPIALADPDIDTESAASVIEDLKEQGYDVRIDGVSGDDTDLLTTCRVLSIQDSGEDSPDPTKTTTVYVSIACPIQHG